MSRQGSQIGIGTDSQQQVPPRGIGLLASSIRGDYRSWGTKEGRDGTIESASIWFVSLTERRCEGPPCRGE